MSVFNWVFKKGEKLIIKSCRAVSRKLSNRTIENEGLPYLTRFYVLKKARSIDWGSTGASPVLKRALRGFVLPDSQPTAPEEDGQPTFKWNRWLSVYLHYFHRGDEDASLHNHPWSTSYSLILTNGYMEERWDPKLQKIVQRTIRPGSINRILANDFHRVELLDPTRGAWTLFFSGARLERPWGFWWPGVHDFTPWFNFVRKRNVHERAN